MRRYAEYDTVPEDEYRDRMNFRSHSSATHTSNETLLEAVEQAMDRDPHQEFDLLLVLERKRD